MRTVRFLQASVLMMGVSFATFALAESPLDFLTQFEAAARQESASFQGFSALRGARFFRTTHGQEWSCSSCHTENPSVDGKHAKTAKRIAPLAPAANVERFSNPSKVEKWFKRNCNDVLGRICSAQEKGDVVTYLTSLKK